MFHFDPLTGSEYNSLCKTACQCREHGRERSEGLVRGRERGSGALFGLTDLLAKLDTHTVTHTDGAVNCPARGTYQSLGDCRGHDK